MHINRENYEAWLLDMIEGKLSPEQEEVLMQYLAENPDLEAGTDLLEMSLHPPEINFPRKEDIKKGAGPYEINKGNYEQFCIARIEGDLSAFAEKALADFLSDNPECARTARLYDLVIIKPDNSIHFPDKHMLRKRRPATGKLQGFFRPRVVYRSLSIAASVALLLSASVFLRHHSRLDHPVTSHLDREIPLAAETDQAPDALLTPEADNYREQIAQINIESLISTPSVFETVTPEVSVKEEEVPAGSDPVIRDHGLIPMPAGLLNEKFEVKTAFSRPHLVPEQMAGLYRPPVAGYEEERQGPVTLLSGFIGFLSRTMDDDPERDRITLWDIADAGLKGINTVAGTDMRFEREYNQEGDLVSMAFNSRVIEFRRSTTTFED